ncbi:MAG: HAMP domain-containing protein [Bacteroidales bacterium]|nr:HAMP domain-containing protein [Bacteroidales bacterium]MCB9013535.1 HAMP domain-containing protein [Bacteroidales bacterium]
MPLSGINQPKYNKGPSWVKGYVKFRSSIYGLAVFTITLLSVFLFLSFGIIFKSVNEQYLNTIIRQNGNNIGSMVEGALYRSMLENDKGALQSTLDIINTLSGIDDVNMYDNNDNLVYSSFSHDTVEHINPNCLNCHTNLKSMFPLKEKSYRIIDLKSECVMYNSDKSYRHLLIKSPILNEKSCYTANCHAHKESEEVLGSLIIQIPLKDLDAAVKKTSTQFYFFAVIITFLLLSFLILFTREKIRKPLNAIIKASKAVSNGDTSTRLDVTNPQLDDMRMVSLAFNNMLDNLNQASIELHNWSHQLEYKVQKKSEELLEAQNELIHIERIASLGKLSSSVAHEINNPLSGVLTYTKLIYKQLSKLDINTEKKEIILKNLKVVENETKRCGDIVKGLLDFSKKDQHNFENSHLHKILRETYDLMSHQMKIANISFIADFNAKNDLIYCSPNQIKQACVAILVNSSEAVSESGEVVIRTKNIEEDKIKIEICDNGCGISPDDIPHIFEPFFSAKQNASGIGLGLAIVHGIVQSHNGSITVDSELGKRTCISIELPLILQKEDIS